ncbi:PAS domain S-box protein [Halalkalibacter alkaliphilus]|uniref:PAS domain S-box protein n=1 Tax=Halalkalibacter alkaliphilus TaxID=2917993 RepID=A0A9X2A4G1_9BACI|nr:PAS domain S-box protein [Halalkalibacter alkaliphilus]MCL7746678.1 PAS domain S-box protein [Halalkalibacter alkaliphilus]
MFQFINDLLSKDIGSMFKIVKDIFDTLHEMVVLMEVHNDTFRYVAINKKAYELLGIGDEVIGKTLEESRPEAAVSFIKPKYTQVFQTKKPFVFEEKFVVNGENQFGETSLTPIFLQEGECRYILAISRDITDRKTREREMLAANKRIKESEQRFNSLFYENEDAVFVMDVDGYFSEANAVVKKMIGYRKGEFLHRHFIEFLESENQQEVLAYYEEVLQGKSISYEIQVRHKRGYLLDLKIQNIPMTVDGEVVGVYGIAKDITKEKRTKREMKEIREELQLIWDNTSEAIYTISKEGVIQNANPAFESMFGWSIDEIKSQSVPALFLDPETEHEKSYLELLAKGEDVVNVSTRKKRKDGKAIDVLASYRPVHNEEISLIGTYRDITDAQKVQQKLIRSEKRYRKLVELSPEPIVVHSNDRIVYINPSGVAFFGGQHENDLLGKSIWELIQPDSIQKIEERISWLIENDNDEETTESADLHFRRLDGKSTMAEVTSVSAEYNGQPAIQSVLRDTTERKQYEEQLEYLAFHDPLTGLVNRRMFNELIDQSLEEAKRYEGALAVMYLDMDKFKNVNDQLGHDVGDEILKQFAKRLEENIRDSDIACRIGGDEFLILLKRTEGKKKEISSIAKRIFKSLQQPYFIQENTLVMTSSIGIAMYPGDGLSSKTLIRNADHALYEAKETRNSFKFYKDK